MSREYYLCWNYGSAPRDCVEDCVAEINDLLKSKGLYLRTYEPEETDGYDFKMIFEIEKNPITSVIPTPKNPTPTELNTYFDNCLRHWAKSQTTKK